jgi:hypothetical protein
MVLCVNIDQAKVFSLECCKRHMAATLGLIATMLIVYLCWLGIHWLIGTAAWLGSWYACVIECMPILRYLW